MSIYDGTNGPVIKVYVDSGNLGANYFVLGSSTLSSTSATVTAASGNGTTVTYTASNTFTAGQTVTITGLGIASGSSLNLAAVIIATASSTQFTVTNSTVGVSSGTGTAKQGDVLHTYSPLTSLVQIPSTDVRSISIRRGRTREDQAFQPGTMTLTLDNRSGAYDPQTLNATYSSGTYSMFTGGTNMKVTATWSGVEYSLYAGYIEFVEVDQSLDPIVTITCVDFFKRLADAAPLTNFTAYTQSGSVAASIFSSFGWNYGGLYCYGSYNAYVEKPTDNPLAVLERLASGQGGRVFCGKDGSANFQGYDYIVPAGAASLTFSDQRTSGTIEYDNIVVTPGSRYLLNSVVVTPAPVWWSQSPYGSAVTQTFTNTGSSARFGLAQNSITSYNGYWIVNPDGSGTYLQYPDPTISQYLADHFANAEYRVETLDFEVSKLDALGGTIWPNFLNAEIGTKISVARTPVYTTARTYTCLIQGMNHDITPNSWRCNLMLSPAS